MSCLGLERGVYSPRRITGMTPNCRLVRADARMSVLLKRWDRLVIRFDSIDDPM